MAGLISTDEAQDRNRALGLENRMGVLKLLANCSKGLSPGEIDRAVSEANCPFPEHISDLKVPDIGEAQRLYSELAGELTRQYGDTKPQQKAAQ